MNSIIEALYYGEIDPSAFPVSSPESVELSVHDGKTAFQTGFLLGARLMLELLQTDI